MGAIKKTKKVLKEKTIENNDNVVKKTPEDVIEETSKIVEPKQKKVKRVVVTEGQKELNEPKKKKTKIQKKTTASTPSEAYVPGMLSSIFGKESDKEIINTVALKTIQGESTTVIEKKKVEEVPKEKPNREKGEKPSDRNAQRAKRALHKHSNTTEENDRTIFIGNAPISCTEKTIRALFKPYGAIESIRMRGVVPSKEALTKRICNTKRKFHWNQQSVLFYVKFKEAASVEKALEKNGEEIDGHKIRVSTLSKKKDYDKNTTVYIGNLPFTAQEDEVAAVFEESVGPVEFVRITRDKDTGIGKGFGFVCFKEKNYVDLALQTPDIKYDKRILRVTKLMKKKQIEKRVAVQKLKTKKVDSSQEAKIDQYKFSTASKKTRSDDQVERRKLKKSAVRAIKRKRTVKSGRSIMK
ncbi:unnamed protein product [Auanema sp. JU1783]|nr:unnamed protein product [Auanema sp. JU1783]